MEEYGAEIKEITESPEQSELNTETEQEPVDLIEIARARARHENSSGIANEHIGDILVMQITLCIIIMIIFASVRILKPEFFENFLHYFHEMTKSEPEEFIKRTVSEIVRLIND